MFFSENVLSTLPLSLPCARVTRGPSSAAAAAQASAAITKKTPCSLIVFDRMASNYVVGSWKLRPLGISHQRRIAITWPDHRLQRGAHLAVLRADTRTHHSYLIACALIKQSGERVFHLIYVSLQFPFKACITITTNSWSG